MAADELTALRARVAELERLLDAAKDQERERIASGLEYDASLLPCEEDAEVTRSNAKLVRAGFSYSAAFDTPDPHDASLPWPCTCGRTNTDRCEKCDPRDARIAVLEAALRELRRYLKPTRKPGLLAIIDRALGEETRGG